MLRPCQWVALGQFRKPTLTGAEDYRSSRFFQDSAIYVVLKL